jgi:hypothetical protein
MVQFYIEYRVEWLILLLFLIREVRGYILG